MPAVWAEAIAQRNLLRYAGYVYDAHCGLYYLQRRHYDPLTRQFLSRDPLRADGDESPYQYCGGNPVAATDPWGLYASASGERDDPQIYVPQSGLGSGHRGALSGDASLYARWQGSLGIARPDLAPPPMNSCSPGLGTGRYPPGWLWLEADYREHPDRYWMLVMLLLTRSPGRAGEVGWKPRCATPGGAPKGGGAEPVRIGHIGEAANPASEIGPKTPFSINGRNRIADGRRPGTWYEVKNTKYASRTRQVRDYVDLAQASKESFVLRLREGTEVSGPLRQWHADPKNPLNIEWWVP
jgi:RHS repeat-associated protein